MMMIITATESFSFVGGGSKNIHHKRALAAATSTLTKSITSTTATMLSASSSSSSSTQRKTTLDKATDWNLRIVLRGVATEQGKKVDQIFVVKCQFLEEEGYEPPQGVLLQQDGSDQSSFQVQKSRWLLSEDPDDRKDGLWVWGLFKEPLYPFMLLQMETSAIPLSGGGSKNDDSDNEDKEEENKPDSIKPLQLYAQINHKRDSDVGVILEACDLKVRQVETMKADVFGAAKVDVYEEVNVGTLSIQPILK